MLEGKEICAMLAILMAVGGISLSCEGQPADAAGPEATVASEAVIEPAVSEINLSLHTSTESEPSAPAEDSQASPVTDAYQPFDPEALEICFKQAQDGCELEEHCQIEAARLLDWLQRDDGQMLAWALKETYEVEIDFASITDEAMAELKRSEASLALAEQLARIGDERGLVPSQIILQEDGTVAIGYQPKPAGLLPFDLETLPQSGESLYETEFF